MTTKIEPIAWMYENQNVKDKWYLVWTEPSELGFSRVPLFTKDQLVAAVAEEREKIADLCDQMALYTGVDCAAAIRRQAK